MLGIRLDPELAKRLRILAASRGVTITKLVEDAIRQSMPPVRVVESKRGR